MAKITMSKNKTIKSQRTRELILLSAAKQFARHGYNGVSLDTMASKMKLTKGALYGHFKSKQELYIESLVWYIGNLLDEKIKSGFEGKDGNERLMDYMRWLLLLMETDPYFRQILLRVLIDSDKKIALIITKKVYKKPFLVLVSLIEESHPDKDAKEYAN